MSEGIRAVRNNNPGNIEKGSPWQGLMPASEMTPDQADEQRFCVFQSPKWGFRALARVLIAYQDKHNIRTIAGVITRWAPTSENDTKAYINHVCKLTERAFNEAMDFHNYADLAPLVKAIATHECGGWFFDDDDLDAGLQLAGVPKPVVSVVQNKSVKAATVATAATTLGLVSEAVQQVAPTTGLLKEVATYAPTAAGVLVVILGCYIVYRLYLDTRRVS